MIDDIIRVMAKARFIAYEQERDNIQNKVAELSSQVEALKVQAESSRLHIETLVTQNAELSAQLQEVKAKNLETSRKFEKFVDALYKPAKSYTDMKIRMRSSGMVNLGDTTVDNLYGLIEGAVKAAEMYK